MTNGQQPTHEMIVAERDPLATRQLVLKEMKELLSRSEEFYCPVTPEQNAMRERLARLRKNEAKSVSGDDRGGDSIAIHRAILARVRTVVSACEAECQ